MSFVFVIIPIAVILALATLFLVLMNRDKAEADNHPPLRGRGPTPGAVILIAFSLVLTIVLGVAYTTYSLQTSNHNWCSTLTLLTKQPVPKPTNPAQNPSREQAYIFYTDFVALKGKLGC